MAEEKIYTIPLKEAWKKAYTKRVPYSVRLIRSFLERHTKAKTVKLGRTLNTTAWSHGIKKPLRKVRVRAVIDEGVCKAELLGFEYEEFKAEAITPKEKLADKLKARLSAKEEKAQKEEEMIEGKKEEKVETKTEAKAEEVKTEAKAEAKQESKA